MKRIFPREGVESLYATGPASRRCKGAPRSCPLHCQCRRTPRFSALASAMVVLHSGSGRHGRHGLSSLWSMRTATRPTTTWPAPTMEYGRSSSRAWVLSNATASGFMVLGCPQQGLASTQPSCSLIRTPGRSPAALTTRARFWTTPGNLTTSPIPRTPSLPCRLASSLLSRLRHDRWRAAGRSRRR